MSEEIKWKEKQLLKMKDMGHKKIENGTLMERWIKSKQLYCVHSCYICGTNINDNCKMYEFNDNYYSLCPECFKKMNIELTERDPFERIYRTDIKFDMNTKKLCKCGCGKYIKVLKSHKYVGIPDYIKGHCRRLKKTS